MKDRNNVTKALDSISAIIDAILFALVPVAFCDNNSYQVASYFAIVFFQLLYVFFFREKIIDVIVFPHGVDTESLLRANLAEKLRQNILPKLCEIQGITATSAFEEYTVFLKWKEISTFIIQHFWDDCVINVELEKRVKFSEAKIYKKELEQIVDELILVVENNGKFAKAVKLFNCDTLASEIIKDQQKLNELKNALK